MAIYKNQTGQKIPVFAYDTVAKAPKTGDAANITAQIAKDGGVSAATNDVNPTELDATDQKGIYLFDMLQAETNADLMNISPVSSTANIVLEPVAVFTLPGSNVKLDSHALSIENGAIKSATFTMFAIDANAINTAAFTALKFGAGFIKSSSYAAGAIDAAALNADAVDKIVDQNWNELTSGHVTVGSFGVAVTDLLGRCSELRLAELDAANIPADVDTLLARLTAARAAKLDNIPAGLMPTQAEVLAIQNNTRTTIAVPTVAERPDSGSTRLKIYLNNYDTAGNMEAPDSAPVMAVANEEGVSRSGNLQHPTTHVPQTTMVNISVGRYWIEYDLDNGAALESLIFTSTVIEGGVTRTFDRQMLVVDTTAVDFTAADRAVLEDIPNTAEFVARTILATSYFDPAADTVANVTTSANLTTLPSIPVGWLTPAGIALDAIDSNAVAAEVITSIVNAQWTRPGVEPSSPPLQTASLEDKLNWLAAFPINEKDQSASTFRLHNAAKTAIIATSTITVAAGVTTMGAPV